MAKGVLACILAVGFFAAAVHAAPSKPGLRLLAKSPVTLRGTGFYARERVHVTAAAGGMRQVRTTTATRAGAFTVQLPAALAYDPCLESLTITAVGKRGDAAWLKLPQRACPPAP